jgi:hypothetical protein
LEVAATPSAVVLISLHPALLCSEWFFINVKGFAYLQDRLPAQILEIEFSWCNMLKIQIKNYIMNKMQSLVRRLLYG